MRYISRLGARTAVIAISVMAVLAGCGHAAPATPPPPPPMPIYANVIDLGTAMSNQMKLDKTVKTTTNLTVSGATVTDGEGTLLISPTGFAARVDQRLHIRGAVPEMSMIILPDQAYFTAPTLLPLPPGKSWARLRPETSNPILRPVVRALQDVRLNVDPSQRVVQMSGAATLVESAEEPLDGVRTMRYRIRFDLNQVAAQVTDPRRRENVQRMLTLARSTGKSTMDDVLWLDERNRPQRFLIEQPAPGGQGTVKIEARYHDWGQPVDIQPPPADQVADI